jgi:hypothetical protein
MYSYLNDYCERAGDGSLMGEPLNAATNLFFILAAILAALALRKAPRPQQNVTDLWLLVLALFSIGIGSGIWHLHPTLHTELMDVIPIGIFINIYLLSALRRLHKFSWWRVGRWFVIYQLLGYVAQKYFPPDYLNGTIMYIPTYAMLVAMTIALIWRDKAAARQFFGVVLLWTASLIFRTIDMDICAHFPLGTHFLWHTLNALVLYKLLMILVKKVRQLS